MSNARSGAALVKSLVQKLDCPVRSMISEYPSETFRVLEKDELARFDEYRIQRLVLAAFDRLTGS